MAEGLCSGQMGLSMKASGRWDMHLASVPFITLTETFTMATGNPTSATATESTPTKKEPSTRAVGKTTPNLVKELKFGLKEVSM